MQHSWLNLCRGKTPHGEAPVIQDPWGVRNPSCLSLSYPLWRGLQAHNTVQSMGQIELFNI